MHASCNEWRKYLHSITCRMSTSAHTKHRGGARKYAWKSGKPLDKNILVISDLHLGEDLRPGGANVSYLRHLATLERELERFLAHYTSHRLRRSAVAPGGQRRHGRLHVGDDPPPGQGGGGRRRERTASTASASASASRRRRWSASSRATRACSSGWASSSPPATSSSSSSATTTSSSTIPSVQRTLVEWLCGLVVGMGADETRRASPSPRASRSARGSITRKTSSTSSTGTSTTSTARSIICCIRWRPIRKSTLNRKSRIALSVAHAGMRYFANQIPDYDPHTAETVGLCRLHEVGVGAGARAARLG